MSSNYSSKAQSIDYDAIMRSIKLDKKTQGFPNSKHTNLGQNSQAEHRIESDLEKYDTFNRKQVGGEEKRQVKGCENVYQSVVFDDYCQQSCFESIYRNFEKQQAHNASQNVVPQKACDKNYFRFYDDSFRGKAEEEEKVCTPKHLKKERSENICCYQKQNYQQSKSQDKQNNNSHNTIQPASTMNQFRYLTHTETSQKKITKRSMIIGTKNSERPKSIAKPKKQAKRPGIQLIYDNVYQRA